MKILSPNKINKNIEAELQQPERDFLLDKTISIKFFRECFFLDLKVGRDYRLQDTRIGISARRRKFKTLAICLFGILALYMVIGSIIFTLYTLKSRVGLDIFPDIHFFNF